MRLIFRSFASAVCMMAMTYSGCHGQRFVPHTLMVGLEAPGIVRSLISRERNMGEIQANLNVASHLIVLEYGFENVDRGQGSFRYSTKGPYFRSGIDFTLNPKNPAGHKIFFGFRYARANYRNSISFEHPSFAYNNPQINVNDHKVKANWLEGTFGIKVVLKKNLAMGYTMRYKFGREIRSEGTLSSFDLPGYGRAGKSNNFGFNYHVYYRFRFRQPKTKPTER